MPTRRVLPQRAPARGVRPPWRPPCLPACNGRQHEGAAAWGGARRHRSRTGLGGLSLTRRHVGRRKTATGEEGYFPVSHVEEQAPPPLQVLAAVAAVAEEGAAAGDLPSPQVMGEGGVAREESEMWTQTGGQWV